MKIACIAAAGGLLSAIVVAAALGPASSPTHAASRTIGSTGETRLKRLSTFCLNADGNLLCCDTAEGVVKVVSPDGKLVAAWKPPVTPQAICSAGDGTIYVGGAGKIAKLDKDGKALKTVAIEAAGTRPPRIAAVTASAKDVFVSARIRTGCVVYRFDRELGAAKRIITGLRGCCGQMDIKARGKELFVAENARFRVSRYDREGKRLASWGKRDRKALDGWGGCCNPMNLCFAPDGSLLTSESTSPGRVKRFSLDGKFLGLVGEVRGASGCKHVAVAVSKDGGKVFVVDTSRGVVHVLATTPVKAAQ